MRSILGSIGVFATFALSVASPFSAALAANSSPRYYGAWIPFWQAQPGQRDIAVNLDRLDEVSPFSYEARWNGDLIDSLKIGSGSWFGWLTAVHDAGVKIIPTIAWFDGGAIYDLLSNAKKRVAEEDKILALVRAQRFDGIDIDFEEMVAGTRPYFSLFIKGLALRLHPLGKKVTCTVMARMPADSVRGSISSDLIYADDLKALNRYCDEIRVMAYDQQTIDIALNAVKGNGNLYSPVADPAWVEKVIKETLRFVSRKKLMLGAPTYGYEYQVSWANGETTYERVRSFSFMDAMDRTDEIGVAPARNNANELSFTFASTTRIQVQPALISTVASPVRPAALANPDPNASTTFFVSFPDAASVADKVALVKKYGLRGVMFFKADGEMDPAIWGQLK